ncbi:MAG: cation-transporting P-type ATPase, partial [Gaiellaceae bacterium]
MSVAAPETRTELPWHTLDADTVAARLETSLAAGLSAEEAARRLAEHGPNELEARGGVAPWRLLLEQFKNVLI